MWYFLTFLHKNILIHSRSALHVELQLEKLTSTEVMYTPSWHQYINILIEEEEIMDK